MMVLAKAAEGRKDELASWYDGQHFGDLLAVEGFVSAERHDVIPMKGPDGLPIWDFLLIYEIEGNPMTVLGTMAGMLGTERMPTSDALESTHTLSIVALSKCYRRSDASRRAT